MAITKKKNKFTVPQEYNQSVIFAKGGNLYLNGGFGQTGRPMQFGNIQTPKWDTQINNQGIGSSMGQPTTGIASTTKTPFNSSKVMGQGLSVAQGAMQLGTQVLGNFDTNGIGSEVQGVNDISRGDILNTNINVDSKQTNGFAQAGSGALTGAQAGQAFGPEGMAIGAGIGALAGGLSSIFGNKSKKDAANLAQQQWNANLGAKDRQFQNQDLKSDMANYNANGGDLFAYGGNIQSNSPLTQFSTGGTHEQNPNGGIMQGTGANGQPNLVEQGETKHEDYIFSDRLKVNPKITKEFKLPSGLNGKTFAAASKYLNKEAKERPNDPISNNAVKAQLAKLTAAQEGLKEQMQPQQTQQQQGIPMQGQQPMQQDPMQAQQLQQPQEQPQGNIIEDGSQQFKFGGYKPKKPLRADNKMAMLMSSVQKMMVQGMSQEDIEMQLQKSGVNADQAEQIVMSAMQQTKGQAQPQQQGIPMGGQQMANGGMIDQSHYQNPTLQGANISAMGGNVYGGPFETPNASNYIQTQVPDNNFQMYQQNQMFPMAQQNTEQPWSPINTNNYFPQSVLSQKERPFIDTSKNRNVQSTNPIDNNTTDFSRYAPVAANIATGISDMFEQPEVVRYGRVSPELNNSRMNYQPIDTEWMNNKMNATYAGTRDQMINNAGGNRAQAMAGLSGINQQQQNAVGEQYLKSQDMNYNRRNQATQFNAAIEGQNVAAQNAAQQQNLQLQMAEMDANARNRAAKRNAARQAILNAAGNIGDIGKENYAAKVAKNIYGYDQYGNFVAQDGKKYDKSGKLIG